MTTKVRTWPTRRIPLAKIHPNEWNPNRLSVGLQRKLQRGVEDPKLGVLVDLLVRPCKKHRGRDFEIVDGEHRWEVYKAVGIDAIKAKVADLGDDEAKMAGTILNELRGTLELDRFQELAAGLASTVGIERMAELMPWREDALRRLVGEGALSGAPEDLGAVPKRFAKGAVWKVGEHVVACADSTDAAAIADLVRDPVDFLFTSPPYNVGKPYRSHDDRTRAWDAYSAILRAAMRAWAPRLGDGRAVGWNVGTAPHTFPWRQAALLEEAGLDYVRTVVWEKPGVARPSSYQMVRTGRVRHFTADYTFELVLLASKGPLERGAKADLGEQLDRDVIRVHMNMGARGVPIDAAGGGTDYAGLGGRQHKHTHPAAFPPSLPEAFVRHFADPGAVVADPFGGIGSTAVAAARSGRVGLSVDVDPRYCDVALLRLERETGGKAEEA